MEQLSRCVIIYLYILDSLKKKIMDSIDEVLRLPATDFIADKLKMEGKWKSCTEKLFALAKKFDRTNITFQSQLIVDDFDLNQIWQQIDLFNKDFIMKIEPQLSLLETPLEQPETSEKLAQDEEENVDEFLVGEEKDLDGSDQEELLEENYSDDQESKASSVGPLDEESGNEEEESEEEEWKPSKKSVVDDKFFSLEEMERFTEMAEKQDIKMANRLADGGVQSDSDEEDIFAVGKGIKSANSRLGQWSV